ncbi:HD domain-containing protein [Halobaculum magnesiiphilum]|uniref:HD domain-containing protein n=1 Tax=Halobaculum magnesiiphilum TaxID=1017351 RepID=A0A8T8WCA5_9EURY|nr:HD domain-containing protein [Halobaculum magnesiiphilum]QZP37374.1 HD domain-containing protein [Halobaculum magnesiiphilum]
MTDDAPSSTNDDTPQPVADSLPDDLAEVFPAYAEIADPDLRVGVRDAYAVALAETDWTDLDAVPWLPDEQARLGLPDETNVRHVNDVAALATALADALLARRPDSGLDRDLVVAGALLHDISKLYEFGPGDADAFDGDEGPDGDEATVDGRYGTEYYDLLGHPYVGVHVCEAAGLSVELSHVVLSHTGRTAVEPATLEAEIVKRADEVAAATIRARALEDLRDT